MRSDPLTPSTSQGAVALGFDDSAAPDLLSRLAKRVFRIGDFRLSAEPRIDHYAAKSGFELVPDYFALSHGVPEAEGVPPGQVIDLTGKLRADGSLAGRAGETAERSAKLATELLSLMGLSGRHKVHLGAPGRLASAGDPVRSPGTQAIVDEAMRTDTTLPLFVAVGGGLTEVASALMAQLEIAGRFTLVWIGGDRHPVRGTGETNFGIDPIAAQYVFNDTTVPIWQVPRSFYSTCVVSASELRAFVAPHGRIGPWLYEKLFEVHRKFKGRLNTGETWTMGDNPLVLLTALTDWGPSEFRPAVKFERTGSSLYENVQAPRLNADGTYASRADGRSIRVYTSVDNRMMFNDLFAKLRLNYGG